MTTPDWFFSQLTAASSVVAGDYVPVLKTLDTTTPPAGAHGSNQRITAQNLAQALAGLSGSITWIEPSADTSGTDDTAAILAALATGACFLAPGQFYVKNIVLDTGQELAGAGWATILNVVSGTTGDALALAHAATTCRTTIRHLTLNCGDNICAGVHLDNTGFGPDVQWVPFDPMHYLDHVLVLGAGGDSAFHFTNVRETRAHVCIQYNASGYGFHFDDNSGAGPGATDNRISDSTSGKSGLDSWHIEATSGNNGFVNIKGFYAGWSESAGAFTSTTSVGLYNAGNWNTFVSCSMQQSAFHGIVLDGCSAVSVTGCEADTNGAATATGSAGIYLNNPSSCVVTGNVGSNNSDDPPGAQQWGILTAGTMTGCTIAGNAVSGTSGTLSRGDTDGGENTIIDSAAVQLNFPFLQTPMGVLGLTTLPSVAQFFALIYGWDGSGGSGYAQLGTTTGAGWAAMLQMAQYASTASIASSSTTETALASTSVPANDPVAGAVYKVSGFASSPISTSAPTITWRLRWGGTSGTLLAVTAAIAETASQTGIWEFEGTVIFTSATQCTAKLRVIYNLSSTSETAGRYGAGTTGLAVNTTATTVTVSSAESLVVTAQFSAADSQTLAAVGYPERVA